VPAPAVSGGPAPLRAPAPADPAGATGAAGAAPPRCPFAAAPAGPADPASRGPVPAAPAGPAGAAPPRGPVPAAPAGPASRGPAGAAPADAVPRGPAVPGPASALLVAVAGLTPAGPAGGSEGAEGPGPAGPGAAVPRGAASAEGGSEAAGGSLAAAGLAGGPPAGCREPPRLGRGTRCGRLCRSSSGAPGFQRAEIGRLLTVISPVSGRPAIFGWLGARRGASAGSSGAEPFSFPWPVPDPLSRPVVFARARDFHRPARAAAAARSLCNVASLACSRSTTASGSPRSLRILSTTAGSAVSRPPDCCSINSRVRARNARLSSDWSLVRAATERRLR
jgi:hypothetical protein